MERLRVCPSGLVRELRRGSRTVVYERTDRQTRPVQLDLMGEEVFQRLQEGKTLERLRAEFARDHKLTPLESRALVLGFVRSLHERGFVRFEEA